MNDTAYFLIAVGVSAIITFTLRALPFILFRGDRKMPEFLIKLGSALPSAIMAVLIVYCLRGAKSEPIRTGIPALVAVIITAISYKLKHSSLISILAGTAVYMALIRIIV